MEIMKGPGGRGPPRRQARCKRVCKVRGRGGGLF